MSKKYAVFIGRLQPIHAGHIKVITEALKQVDEIIILIGSHNEAPSIRNPFNSNERAEMVELALAANNVDLSRVKISVVENFSYNDDRWVQEVHSVVHHLMWEEWSPDACEIYFVGPKKETDPDLKKLFPNWGKIDIPDVLDINATDIRKQIFEDDDCEVYDYLTKTVSEGIKQWLQTEVGKTIREEYFIIKEYKKAWEPGRKETYYDKDGNPVEVVVGPPYPVTFQTVDAVVTQAGHILMVTRGAAPGKGLLALPGGFLNPGETLVDGCIRELREETKIKVPDPVLRGSIKWHRSFDDPHRSARGRTITEAFHIALGPTGPLPKVKGSDDAIKAQWIPMHELDGSKIFEDHLQIIRTMAGVK